MSNVDWRTLMGMGPQMFAAPTSVHGLPSDLASDLADLVDTWRARYPGNAMRQAYLDCHNVVDNLGLSVPPEVAHDLQITSAWPEKAVFSLANRCQWDGVVSPDGSEGDPWGVSDILRANRFTTEISQSIASSATHGVSFVATLPGDTEAGDPDALVMFYSALTASALWDRRRRGIRAGLLINDVDTLGRPTELIMLTPEWMLTIRQSPVSNGARTQWAVTEKVRHNLGRTPMEALPYRPNLDRPLGRSRLSRGVLSIVDRALRAALRMDVSSELFTAPGILLNGIDEETFAKLSTSWSWRMGSVKGLTRDEEGEVPDVTTLPQQSMQPYVEQLRELAMEYASALSIPVGSLGIVQDNPSSADAIYAANEEIVIEATRMNEVSSFALSRVYQNVIMLSTNVAELPDDAKYVGTHWINPARPSIVSQSDAMVKQISAIPDLAKTDVALEELGYDHQQIIRIRGQIEAAQAKYAIQSLLRPQTPAQQAATVDESTQGQVNGAELI